MRENLSTIFSSYPILAFFLIPNLGLLARHNYISQHFSLNIKDSTEIKPFGALSLTDPFQEQFGYGNNLNIGLITVSRTRLLRAFKTSLFPWAKLCHILTPSPVVLYSNDLRTVLDFLNTTLNQLSDIGFFLGIWFSNNLYNFEDLCLHLREIESIVCNNPVIIRQSKQILLNILFFQYPRLFFGLILCLRYIYIKWYIQAIKCYQPETN